MLGDSLRRRKPAPAPGQPSSPPRRGSFGWRRWLTAAVVILLGSFITGYLLSTQVLFPAPETAGTGLPVPDLYGLDREEAEGRLVEAGLGVGRVETMASADALPGQVLAQSPVAGQQLRRGAAVDFVVSTGPPEIRVPPVEGLAADMARDLLGEAGFAVELKQLPSPDPQGVVARADPMPGTAQPLPATVTLFVSLGPPQIDTTLVEPGVTGGGR